jgi:5S rRNA maturation endonuclease (ribonuclease M5)
LEMERAVCWQTHSMSGELMGILARELGASKYRWAQKPNCEHLPIMFGSPRDYQLLWDTRRMVLTEGQFDRVAMKRLLPEDTAVFARLTKGVGKLLLVFVQRYADEVITIFDNDDPGKDATDKTEEKIPTSQSLLLPTKDPSKLLELYGFPKAKELVRRRWSMLGL